MPPASAPSLLPVLGRGIGFAFRTRTRAVVSIIAILMGLSYVTTPAPSATLHGTAVDEATGIQVGLQQEVFPNGSDRLKVLSVSVPAELAARLDKRENPAGTVNRFLVSLPRTAGLQADGDANNQLQAEGFVLVEVSHGHGKGDQFVYGGQVQEVSRGQAIQLAFTAPDGTRWKIIDDRRPQLRDIVGLRSDSSFSRDAQAVLKQEAQSHGYQGEASRHTVHLPPDPQGTPDTIEVVVSYANEREAVRRGTYRKAAIQTQATS